MDQLQFKLEDFEGPLDLLLHLVHKHKMDIQDIKISLLLEQYLDYMNQLKAKDIEISSEFLEMAARLVYIKTCSLLPRPQEEEKLREALTGELLQLEMVKKIAANLEEQCCFDRLFSRSPSIPKIRTAYSVLHQSDELMEAYKKIKYKLKYREPPSPSVFSDIVEHRIVSITSRVVYILRKLYKNGRISYSEFFQSTDRSEMVATFLAMLELVKSKRICFSQNNEYVVFIKNNHTET